MAGRVGVARAVLSDHHRHIACGTGEAVTHHSSVVLMGAIPKLDAGSWEEVGNGHHGRAVDAEGVVDFSFRQYLGSDPSQCQLDIPSP